MKVTLLGSSGAVPIPERAQSGILIQTSEANILLDCGMAVPLRLKEAGIDAESIDLICLSHKHLDHIQDLPSLTKAAWLRTDEAEYDIICHPAIKDYIEDFLKSCGEYERANLEFDLMGEGEKREYEDVLIETFKTKHTDDSLGFKLSQKNVEVIYTSDTAINEEIKKKADGVSLLIHELTFIESREDHTGLNDIIDLLTDINVGEVILTHFDTEVDKKIDKIVKKINKETGISVTPSYDLQEIIL
ncbi:MAG: MBL fold metallo-hydrolase [Thermoplasmatota archaeon]